MTLQPSLICPKFHARNVELGGVPPRRIFACEGRPDMKNFTTFGMGKSGGEGDTIMEERRRSPRLLFSLLNPSDTEREGGGNFGIITHLIRFQVCPRSWAAPWRCPRSRYVIMHRPLLRGLDDQASKHIPLLGHGLLL